MGWLLSNIYRISRPIRCMFFLEKRDLNSTCILCAEGKYIYKLIITRTSIIQHLYHETVKTTMMMILLAVATIFWVSTMNKLYYGY